MDYTFLLGSIENVLGKGHKKSRGNVAFMCPFCHHRKPKLEINLDTNSKGENPWECWVCQTKGRTLHSLFSQLDIPKSEVEEILSYVRKGGVQTYREGERVHLPAEFKALSRAAETSVVANQVRSYLYSRGITDSDFTKYEIGYCTKGPYKGKVIVPSYNSNNQLNFFIARSYDGTYPSYRNPEVSKDVIFFENLINWDKPVILCEGIFDAFAIKRNVIPILGKNISDSLLKKLIVSKVSDIYIALDQDALKTSLKYCETFMNMGKRVYLVDLDKKDPGEMGFEAFTEKIQTAKELDLLTLMQYKFKI